MQLEELVKRERERKALGIVTGPICDPCQVVGVTSISTLGLVSQYGGNFAIPRDGVRKADAHLGALGED